MALIFIYFKPFNLSFSRSYTILIIPSTVIVSFVTTIRESGYAVASSVLKASPLFVFCGAPFFIPCFPRSLLFRFAALHAGAPVFAGAGRFPGKRCIRLLPAAEWRTGFLLLRLFRQSQDFHQPQDHLLISNQYKSSFLL